MSHDLESVRRDVAQGRLDGVTPVFILGPPRCGTTWAQSTLAAHPDAVVSGETNVFNEVGWPLLQTLQQFRQQCPIRLPLRDGARPTLAALEDGEILRVLRRVVERVFVAYLSQAGRLHEDRPLVVGDKSPGHARHLRMLATMFPEAKFVLCVRDVRDAAVSAWRHFHDFKADHVLAPARDMHEGAEIYARHHWAELIRYSRTPGRELGPSRFIELSYEDHHADPEAAVSRLAEFLGLASDDATVKSIVAANTFERLSGGRSRGEEDVRTVFRRGLVGEWREHFTDAFGDHLVRVAEERLALGEQPVDNTRRVEWLGPKTIPGEAAVA